MANLDHHGDGGRTPAPSSGTVSSRPNERGRHDGNGETESAAMQLVHLHRLRASLASDSESSALAQSSPHLPSPMPGAWPHQGPRTKPCSGSIRSPACILLGAHRFRPGAADP